VSTAGAPAPAPVAPTASAELPASTADWALLWGALTSVVGACVWVFWLMWRHVPEQAAFFEGLGAHLPLAARITIALSNWFTRLLPFLAIVSLPVLFVLVPALIRTVERGERDGIRRSGVILFGIAFVVASACIGAMYALRVAALGIVP